MSVNKFVLNETSYFGKGAREELPGEIQKRGFKKVLVVTDKSLAECGVTSRVTEVLDKAGIWEGAWFSAKIIPCNKCANNKLKSLNSFNNHFPISRPCIQYIIIF